MIFSKKEAEMFDISMTDGFVIGLTQYEVKDRSYHANCIELFLGVISITWFFSK